MDGDRISGVFDSELLLLFPKTRQNRLLQQALVYIHDQKSGFLFFKEKLTLQATFQFPKYQKFNQN